MKIFKQAVALLCFVLPSGPTRLLYRLCGYRIGRNVSMPLFSYLYADELNLGNDVDVRNFVYIHVKRLTVGANTIISFGTQIKGTASFSCGDNCFFGAHCIVHCVEDVHLGFYSGLGPRCTVYTHGSFLPVTMGYPARFAPVVVEDYVWIAMEVTIMPGVHIGRNCLINPGVVLKGRIKPNSIIQVDSRKYETHDLGLLQSILKKDIGYWHHQIISTFLKFHSASYQHDAQTASYTVPGRYTFKSHPETNCIELLIWQERIVYDLEQFYADENRSRVHRDFLAFIRLHHGITLRTRYK